MVNFLEKMESVFVKQQDVSNFSELKRFKLIQQLGINMVVVNYVKTRLQNLTIEIGDSYKGRMFELMNQGILVGWSWQTTLAAIVFFDDEDYIERGNLKISINKWYSHSWICFKFDDNVWIFDPCLRIFLKKDIYYYIFEINNIHGSVTAKSVKEILIDRINNKGYNESGINNYTSLKSNMSENFKNETYIAGDNDANSPMYRSNTGYTATIDNGKINSLIAHYYLNG